jgi:MFS transporter, DHA2 family, multidrug resistance protein
VLSDRISSLALQPPYLQVLMNYPVVTSGLVVGPRGIGTMALMLVVGRLTARLDTRLVLAIGLGLTGPGLFNLARNIGAAAQP